MSRVSRAFLGVAIGAIATLLAHPVSRPTLTSIVPSPRAESAFIESQARSLETLPNPPRDLVQAGLWMQLGASRLQAGRPLSPEEVSSLIRVAQAAAESEPQNAFWRQMSAVFFAHRGDHERAAREWLEASRLRSWSDKQSERLGRIVTSMAGAGKPMAWHYAAAYNLRSSSASKAILRYAESSRPTKPLSEAEDLQFRLTTLRNGSLVSDGARSVKILRDAVAIVDASSHIEPTPPGSELVRREKSRGQILARLRKAGMELENDEAHKIYRETDGRVAITARSDISLKASTTSILALAASSLGGALLLVAAIGAVIYGAGVVATKRAGLETSLAWIPAAAAASLLGVGVFAITAVPMASVATVGCVLLLGFTPKQGSTERTLAHESIAFRYWTGVMGLSFLLLLAWWMALLTTPAKLIIANLPGDLSLVVDQRVYGGLALLVFAVWLVVVPIWSYARGVPAMSVLGFALRRLGRTVAVGGVAATIVAAPLAVYADARSRTDLEQMVGNEPIYYVKLFE